MFVRTIARSAGKTAIQIVKSVREGKQVRQKIIRNLGQGENAREVEVLKNLAESIILEIKQSGPKPMLPWRSLENFSGNAKSTEEIEDVVKMKNLREEARRITGIGEVFGRIYSQLGFDSLLWEEDQMWHSILKACVLARLGHPVSKSKTSRTLEKDYGVEIPTHKIYRMMDRLAKKEDEAKGFVAQSTLDLFDQKVDILFFDVTTLYFESIEADELRAFGFSKDCKFKEVQVVLALVATTDGLPITYELFPGNTYEGKTLLPMIENLQKKFHVENVVLAADRAMFNEANLTLLESKGVKYVVAAKLRSMSQKMKDSILNHALFAPVTVEGESHWAGDLEWNHRRLIVSYSASRAHKDAADRQRLIDRLLKKVKGEKIPLKDLISNRGTSKFLKTDGGTAEIDMAKIAKDQQWDGLHGIVTNMAHEKAEYLLARYRGLWQIEEAFRVNKHDLRMRPIFHWTKPRIRSHISICFLAFAIAKQTLHRLKIKNVRLSFEQLREELLHVQASFVIDRSTLKRYRIPSAANSTQKSIYQALSLPRPEAVTRA